VEELEQRRGLVGTDACVGAQRALHQAHAQAEVAWQTAALAAAGVRVEGTWSWRPCRMLLSHASGVRWFDRGSHVAAGGCQVAVGQAAMRHMSGWLGA
jgi:hypothetical protein